MFIHCYVKMFGSDTEIIMEDQSTAAVCVMMAVYDVQSAAPEQILLGILSRKGVHFRIAFLAFGFNCTIRMFS